MYTMESRVRFSESDANDRLTLPAIIDYFQDCSTFQSEDLGLGLKFLREQHLTWVMSAWQLEISEYPKMGEKIAVRTFPYEFKGCFGFRNFMLDKADGTRVVKANSLWTLMNLQEMMPHRPTPEMYEKFVLEEKLPMNYLPRKIALPAEMEIQESFFIKKQHLDSNGHVNNGQYVKLAAQYLPENETIHGLRVEYKKQAMLGDEITPRVHREEGLCIVNLGMADGTPYMVAEFRV